MAEHEQPKILPHLRSGIIHSTSRESLARILDSGAILPNRGQFSHASSYPLEYFHGGRQGYVCLFDFETPTEQECLAYYTGKWGNVLRWHPPVTIAIRLRRASIPNLKTQAPTLTLDEHGQGLVAQYIPMVEVWSPDPILTSAILGYVVIDATDIDTFRVLPKHNTPAEDLAAIDRAAGGFPPPSPRGWL